MSARKAPEPDSVDRVPDARCDRFFFFEFDALATEPDLFSTERSGLKRDLSGWCVLCVIKMAHLAEEVCSIAWVVGRGGRFTSKLDIWQGANVRLILRHWFGYCFSIPSGFL